MLVKILFILKTTKEKKVFNDQSIINITVLIFSNLLDLPGFDFMHHGFWGHSKRRVMTSNGKWNYIRTRFSRIFQSVFYHVDAVGSHKTSYHLLKTSFNLIRPLLAPWHQSPPSWLVPAFTRQTCIRSASTFLRQVMTFQRPINNRLCGPLDVISMGSMCKYCWSSGFLWLIRFVCTFCHRDLIPTYTVSNPHSSVPRSHNCLFSKISL